MVGYAAQHASSFSVIWKCSFLLPVIVNLQTLPWETSETVSILGKEATLITEDCLLLKKISLTSRLQVRPLFFGHHWFKKDIYFNNFSRHLTFAALMTSIVFTGRSLFRISKRLYIINQFWQPIAGIVVYLVYYSKSHTVRIQIFWSTRTDCS